MAFLWLRDEDLPRPPGPPPRLLHRMSRFRGWPRLDHTPRSPGPAATRAARRHAAPAVPVGSRTGAAAGPHRPPTTP